MPALRNLSFDHVDLYAVAIQDNFNVFQQHLYQPLTLILMLIGAFGNFIGIVVLFRGSTLQTPHFLFYKTLTIAELWSNVNWILVFIIDTSCALPSSSNFGAWAAYCSPAAAVYLAVISRVIASGTGYVIMYMTLDISLDRFAAVWFPTKYRAVHTNRKKQINKCAIAAALLLAFSFNSWAAYVENEVLTHLHDNDTVSYVLTRKREPFTQLDWALSAKDYYNAITRVIYLGLLVTLTTGVVTGFVRIAHRRSSCDPTINLPGSRPLYVRTTQARQRRRIERSLVCLMVAVVSLAFMQVVPVEVRRLLNVVYSEELANSVGQNIDEYPESERLRAVEVYFFGHLALKFAANVATSVDRSLKFYLYVLLNRQIRREALNVCCMSFGWFKTNYRAQTGYSLRSTTTNRSNHINTRSTTADKRAAVSGV